MSRATGPGSRFVAVPADRLLEELRGIGRKVEEKGGTFLEDVATGYWGGGREVFVEVAPPRARAGVRVYTSLAKGAAEARECGEDAVRIVVGAAIEIPPAERVQGQGTTRWRPLEKGQKVLRTAPKSAPDRVGVFLERLREEIRQGYKRAALAPACPLCGKVMGLRSTKDRTRSFYGCVGYPACRGTKSAEVAS